MSQTAAQIFGGAVKHTGLGAVTFDLLHYEGRVQSFEFTTSGGEVRLPDARRFLSLGGPIVTLINLSGPNAFDVVDNADTVLATVPGLDYAILYLTDNTTAAGAWETRVGDWES
jgi:hypothetical protein